MIVRRSVGGSKISPQFKKKKENEERDAPFDPYLQDRLKGGASKLFTTDAKKPKHIAPQAKTSLKPKAITSKPVLQTKERKIQVKEEPRLKPKAKAEEPRLKPKVKVEEPRLKQKASALPRKSEPSIILDSTGRPFSKEIVVKEKKDILVLPSYAYDDPLAFLQSLTSDSNISQDVEALKAHVAEVENELNLRSIILEAFDDAHRNMAPKDLRIDDGDFPQAKNIYEWVTNPNFSGTNDRPFIEQLIWCVMVMAEFCPKCTDMEWLLHTHAVNDSYLTFERKVQMLEYGVCPCCGSRKSQMYRKGEINFYQELAVRAGQRAGKSLTVGSTLGPYVMHRYLKLQKPPAAFGLSNNTTFIGTFVAINYAQAKEALWDYYYNAVSESKWFQGFHGMLKQYEVKYGEHLMKFNDTFTSYRVRNLLIYPAGPDKRSLRGRTRFISSVDEIGWFDSEKDSKKVKVSGHAIYDALDRSLGTIRNAAYKTLRMGFDNIPNAYAFNVSSPSMLSDKICELTKNQNSRTILAIVRPTWEINPEFPRNSEVIEDAYQKDPLGAERDWGANPPLISNPFIGNHKFIMSTVGKKKNPFEVMYKNKNGNNPGASFRWAEFTTFKESEVPTLVGIDAGHVNNSFAAASGYKDGDYFIVDSLVEAAPIPGFPLNYNRMYEKILKPMIVFRNSRGLLADRWNSIKILDDAEEELGIQKKQYSLKYKDLWYVKNAIEGGKVILPRTSRKGLEMSDIIGIDGEYPHCFENRPVEHALFQMATVRDSGSQVLKGDNVTDDLFRAICIMIYGLVCGEFDSVLEREVDSKPMGGGIAVGAFGSGGGKQLGAGNGSGSQSPIGVIRSLG